MKSRKCSHSAVLMLFFSVFCGCSRSAKVSGDIFVTTKSGDVKRGADVEVLLVRGTRDFDAQWMAHVQSFKRDRDAAIATYRNKRAAEIESSRDLDAAKSDFRQLSETRSADIESRRRSYAQGIRDLDASSRNLHKILDRHEEAMSETLAALSAVRDIERTALGVAIQLLTTHRIASARADVSGHFVISAVPHGKYYLFAQYEVFENRLHWFIPVSFNESSNRVDLSGSAAGWVFDSASLK